MKSKSKSFAERFAAEPPTQPSAIAPLRTGKHTSFREPTIDDDAALTPRPRVLLTQVPRVTMHETEIVRLPLRAQSGFILGHIDGKTNVQTLIDIAGMKPDDVLRILDELVLFRVISVK